VTADGALVLPVPPQTLSFSSGGKVLEVAVTEGQDVSEGDELARIDLLPLDMAVADAHAALKSAEDALTKSVEGASRSEIAAASAELAGSRASLSKIESGSDIEAARLEVERAKNTLWGVQAQRDSTCGAYENGYATQASCDQAQANVQASEQGVQLAQQQLESLRSTRDQDLSAARARVSSASAALSKLLEGSSPKQLESLEARVAQAQMAVAAAEADRERAVLRAPFDGTITAVHVAEGIRTAPGSPVVTMAMTRPLRFSTSNLSERNVGDIEEGAPAKIVLTAYPDVELVGSVYRIAPQATEDLSGGVVFAVLLDVEDQGLPLRAGMTGRVEILVEPQG
jgi:multidrug resistance efflux pump